MKYSVTDEILGEPSSKLDGDIKKNVIQVSTIISNITDVELSKIVYFIENFGLKTILNNPSLIGTTKEQEAIMIDLRDLLVFGDDNNGSAINVHSVRY